MDRKIPVMSVRREIRPTGLSPLAVCIAVAAILLLPTGRGASGQETADTEVLPEFQYRMERTVTYRLLVEYVDLEHADWHGSAMESGVPIPGESKRYGRFLHAREGGDLREGDGIALVLRTGESKAGPFGTSIHPYWYRTLTIHLPELAIGEPLTLDLSDDDLGGATVFWTFWGHYRENCYAYPTGGKIKLMRLPQAAGWVDPETRTHPDHSDSSVIADLEIRFDKIISDRISSGPTDPDCPAFAFKERVIFYRTPLEYIPWREKPAAQDRKTVKQEQGGGWMLVYGLAGGFLVSLVTALLYARIRRRRQS